MNLLTLPDELLSTIILETMWATTSTPSDTPDLLFWVRRPTNQPEKVAFVGQICGRLRRIAVAHLKPAQLWSNPTLVVRFDTQGPVVTNLPKSLLNQSYKSIAFSRHQANFLPLVPSSTLQQLQHLSITSESTLSVYRKDLVAALQRCTGLATLAIRKVALAEMAAAGSKPFFDAITSAPTLQALKLEGVYFIGSLGGGLSTRSPFDQAWMAPIIHLELIRVEGLTFSNFFNLMRKASSTLEIAIFHCDMFNVASPEVQIVSEDQTSFPALWRVDVAARRSAHFDWEGAIFTASPSSLIHLFKIWDTAPRLEYLECSEPVPVKTPEKLAEVRELLQRDRMKRLRLKLDTWEGEKEKPWSEERIQELVVG